MIRATLATTALLAQAFVLGGAVPTYADAISADTAAELEDSRITPTVRAVRRARASTVNIHSEKKAPGSSDAIFQSGRDRKVNGMGTGIVVDERGYIVTNHHVVADVDTLRVTLFDGGSYNARVISYDRREDLAIIKIDPKRSLETMPLGTSSDLMLGEDVIAIGNSFGYEHTITRGIVSSLSRDVEVNAEQAYRNLIQTDTAINPGNSGGPLINRNGDVIGINVAIRAGAQKIGFAIPIDDARRVIARLMSVEQLDKKFHGLTLEDRKNGRTHELIVRRVATGSPADKAGIKVGDRVSAVNGKQTVDAADFERMILGQPLTAAIPVELTRGGEAQAATLALRNLDSRLASPAYRSLDQIAAKPVVQTNTQDPVWETFGVKLRPTGQLKTRAGKQYRGGMKVTDVRPTGPAARQAIRSGDVLVGLAQWEVVNQNHIDYVLKQTKTTPRLKFYIVRDGETLFGEFQLRSNLQTANRR